MTNKFCALFAFATVSLFAQAADSWTYTCKSAGKYKDDGAFSQGYTVLTVNSKTAKLEYFYENTVANETTNDSTYVYKLGSLITGSSKVAGYVQALLNSKKSDYSGDGIQSIFLEEALLSGGKQLRNGKLGGLFTFTGHGYAYDWNMCFR